MIEDIIGIIHKMSKDGVGINEIEITLISNNIYKTQQFHLLKRFIQQYQVVVSVDSCFIAGEKTVLKLKVAPAPL